MFSKRQFFSVHCLLYLALLVFMTTGCRAAESISALWSKPKLVRGMRTAAISPDGKLVGFINGSGLLQILSRNGGMLWQSRTLEADALVLGQTGAGAIAYSRMNPDERNVYFLNAKGKVIRKHQLRHPVWCAALDAKGKYAAVGTRSGRIFFYTISRSWASYRRWTAQGVPSTVSIASDGCYLAMGTWNDSGVETYRPSGHYLWRYVHENPNLFFDARVSPSGKLVTAIHQPNPGDQTGRVIVWTAAGQRLLNLNLHAYRIQAMLSQNEKSIAITSMRTITISRKRVPEQKVSLYTLDGKRIWEKGGLFFSPTLVSVAPDGKWVLCRDGDKNLYLLGNKGKILANYDLPMKIQSTYASTDGRTILIVGANDLLQLVRVSG